VIYQHRIVICRAGKLEKRHEKFQSTTMQALDNAGSALIGAWEVYIGDEAGSAVWQLRQFEGMANWAAHQDKVRADAALSTARQTQLYPYLDEVNTSILALADGSPDIPVDWPAIDAMRGQPRGYIEQRILRHKVGGSAAHHAFYHEHVMPALEREGARLIGYFDTLIGDGTTNGKSMRTVELRHFPDLTSWQSWREAQDTDKDLADLIKSQWLPHIEQMHSTLLRPLDYSRIR
jgi:hypothetical protein